MLAGCANTFFKPKGLVMKNISLFLSALIAFPVFAGDLWEVTSTSVGPDGNPVPFKQKNCFPKDNVDPSQMLGGLGNCAFDQKSGNASAMTFSMTCKTPGMPTELESMRVTGDASLNGNRFDMRYIITVSGKQGSPGGDFKMSGSAEARKVGQCDERSGSGHL
jgi:hypothetical protein